MTSHAALIQAATEIASASDAESAVRAGLRHARQVTDAAYAACGIIDQTTGGFGQYITEGLTDDSVRRIGDPPKGRGVLGLLTRQREPIRVADIRTHPESYGFPLDHPVMTSFLGQGLWAEGVAWGSFCVTDKAGGGEFTDADVAALSHLAQFTVGVAAPLHRIAQCEESIADLGRDRAASEASNELARALAGRPDLEHMFELIVKRGRALIGARSAAVAVMMGNDLVVRAVAGTLNPAGVIGTVLPLSDLEGRLLGRGNAVIAAQAGQFSALADRLSGASVMVVPLQVRGQLMGVLACADRMTEARPFTHRELALGESFGTSAAVAIATARSAQEQALQRAIEASERERAHWARELHDQTLQELAAIKLMLRMAHRAGSEDDRRELLAQASDQIDAAAVDLRRLVAELRPAALDAYGLPSAIKGLVDRITDLSGKHIDFHCNLAGDDASEDQRLDSTIEDVVYRVVQEALNNVARHSGASSAVVSLSLHHGTLKVEVSDDGTGFETAAQHGGFGLIGMRERAELIGGDLRVESRAQSGTIVRLVAHVESEVRNG